MANVPDTDVLFEVRNAFYIGNYQQCINEAQKLKVQDPVLVNENEAYLYRSYIAQKRYGVVLDNITASSSPSLKSVRILAEYLNSNDSASKQIVEKVRGLLSGTLDTGDHVTVVSFATVLMHDGDVDTALRLLHQGEHLECLALAVQILLSINRVDSARKEIQRMQQIDEDATLTQLANAQINLTVGGEKLQDAFYIYQELADKYEASAMLLNGQAAAYMAQCRWEDADPLVQEALDKDSNGAQSLINAIVLSQHLGRDPSQASRYISQLKDGHRSHPWVVEFLNKEEEFSRLCKNYTIST